MDIKKEIQKRKIEITTLEAIEYCECRILRHEADFYNFKKQGFSIAEHYLNRIKINKEIIARLSKRFEQ
jgi:hypothetical protein